MFILSSRSATILVIFIVACIAFCLASVFGAMTGPISILPNESSGGILDNLSAITDSNSSPTTYGYDDSQSYSQSSQDSSSSNVETTVDESSSNQQSDSGDQGSSSNSGSHNDGQESGGSVNDNPDGGTPTG